MCIRDRHYSDQQHNAIENQNSANVHSKTEDINSTMPSLTKPSRQYPPPYTSVQDANSKIYSYKPSTSPETIKEMPHVPLTRQVPASNTVPDEKNKYSYNYKNTVPPTQPPVDDATSKMRKYTYAIRTTPTPSNLLRDQLPETPTSYYQYPDSRTGLPYVKSLPPASAKRIPSGFPPRVLFKFS